jgi:CBS domain-containing protein
MNHLAMEPFMDRLHQAEKYDELRDIRDQVHEMLQEHLLFAHTLEFHTSINLFHDALIKRTCMLAEKQLMKEGYMKPQVSYALMLFGSGGRSEQTLWSDQDNGFIYDDSEQYSPEEINAYFAQLVERILQGLEVLGYPPCEGNVVSSNPQWRKPLSAYIDMMLKWFNEPNWENIRYLLILADLRVIYGDNGIVSKLKKSFYDYVEKHPYILESMLSNTLHHKVSIGVFGHLITERYGKDAGGIDIKYGAYIPMVNGIRLLAIQAGIHATSTLIRIEYLLSSHHIDKFHADEWKQAFIIALKLRDLTPHQVEDGLFTTRGKLSSEQLTRETKQELKQILRAGVELQKFIKKRIEQIKYTNKG